MVESSIGSLIQEVDVNDIESPTELAKAKKILRELVTQKASPAGVPIPDQAIENLTVFSSIKNLTDTALSQERFTRLTPFQQTFYRFLSYALRSHCAGGFIDLGNSDQKIPCVYLGPLAIFERSKKGTLLHELDHAADYLLGLITPEDIKKIGQNLVRKTLADSIFLLSIPIVFTNHSQQEWLAFVSITFASAGLSAFYSLSYGLSQREMRACDTESQLK